MKSTLTRFTSVLPARRTSLLALCALIASPLLPSGARADDAPAPFSKVHALLNVEVSDAYITPRGLVVQNNGVVVQPLLILFWDLYSAGKDSTGFIDDVTLNTGIWNSIHSNKEGATPSYWREIDPFAGFTVKFDKKWVFDIGYTAFKSTSDDYKTSTNLDLKLTYHDTWFEKVSINPYVEFFDEVNNKATVSLGGTLHDTGYYFQIGATPAYTIPGTKVKLELPSYFTLVSSNFYHKFSGADGGSGVGLYTTELKATMPLPVSPAYGFWSAYVGVQYYHLLNDGLIDGNQALGATRDRDLVQFHTGVTVFF